MFQWELQARFDTKIALYTASAPLLRSIWPGLDGRWGLQRVIWGGGCWNCLSRTSKLAICSVVLRLRPSPWFLGRTGTEAWMEFGRCSQCIQGLPCSLLRTYTSEATKSLTSCQHLPCKLVESFGALCFVTRSAVLPKNVRAAISISDFTVHQHISSKHVTNDRLKGLRLGMLMTMSNPQSDEPLNSRCLHIPMP